MEFVSNLFSRLSATGGQVGDDSKDQVDDSAAPADTAGSDSERPRLTAENISAASAQAEADDRLAQGQAETSAGAGSSAASPATGTRETAPTTLSESRNERTVSAGSDRSVSSCRSSSDEEELLLIRDQNTGDVHTFDSVYDQFEYAAFPGSMPASPTGVGTAESDPEVVPSVNIGESATQVQAQKAPALQSPNAEEQAAAAAAVSSPGAVAPSRGGKPEESNYDADSESPAGGIAASLAAEEKRQRRKSKQKLTLSDFHLIRVLGKGAFAKVLEVQKASSKNRYAMKVLKKHHVKRKNQVEHTRTERRVLARINHPFICQLRYAFQTRSKLYLVLDYHPGGELFYHLSRRGRFREHQARVFAAEITLALEYLHSMGIVYRDLKPENILIQNDGHIALTDFGLAKDGVTDPATGAKSFCGTPEYLAPEIIHRKGHGTAVDWWSLGMLLYELLTGLPPWYTKNRLHLFEDICWAPLRFPRHVSDKARALIRGMLCRDPGMRFAAAECKAHTFYDDVDWELALNRGLIPPIVPVKGTAYVSREVRKLPLESTGQDPDNSGSEASDSGRVSPFNGFSFSGSRDSWSRSVDYDDERCQSNTQAASAAADAEAQKRAEERDRERVATMGSEPVEIPAPAAKASGTPGPLHTPPHLKGKSDPRFSAERVIIT